MTEQDVGLMRVLSLIEQWEASAATARAVALANPTLSQAPAEACDSFYDGWDAALGQLRQDVQALLRGEAR
jgi:hypothetical protein